MKRALAVLGAVCVPFLSAPPAQADEGMWLLNEAPRDMIAERYGVAATDEWLEHLQKSAVNFGGASASFVSPDGLVMTNHHVARSQLAKLSTEDRNILRDGFFARTRAEELPCPDVVLKQLEDIVDVTDRVKGAGQNMAPAYAEAARKAEIAKIEAEHKEKTGLHAQVVTLYGGGKYHVYLFRRFTDVRVVFAPEGPIAHFGGDVDNFEFPRWCLDIALVRVYDENGEPFKPEHYLRVDPNGVADGDPVFVVGHPGRTQRLRTVDHLRLLRDVIYPKQMHWARTRETQLLVFASKGDRHAAMAERDLKGYQNWRKGSGGKLRALQDPAIFGKKQEEERAFVDEINRRPRLVNLVDDSFQKLQIALRTEERLFDEYTALESSLRRSFAGSDLFRIARILVRMDREKGTPEGERLEEFGSSNLPNIERTLFSEAPIYPELEADRLEAHLAWAAETLGAEHPMVVTMLAGKGPHERARELVAGTRLADMTFRRELAQSGEAAVKASDDAMLAFARSIDFHARKVRKQHEDTVEAIEREVYGKLAEARFSIYRDEVYPDATGSLRLATGTVKGFQQEGEQIEPLSTFAGLFERFEDRGPDKPFDLSQRWIDARDKLGMTVPFNFVSTNDIIGGNSGSPIVDADGELVGVIFDGNRYSFVWDTIYTPERGRAVSVDIRGIIESLRVVYGADELVNEMLGN